MPLGVESYLYCNMAVIIFITKIRIITLARFDILSCALLLFVQMPSVEVDDLKLRISISARVWSQNSVRLVTHSALSPELVAAAIKKLRYVMVEYDNYLVLEYEAE